VPTVPGIRRAIGLGDEGESRSPMSIFNRIRTIAVGLLAVAAVLVGVAAPAYAGYWSTSITNKGDGWSSASWVDHDGDDLTQVQFGPCTREFRARIRRNLPAWDSTWGEEWINCRSYTDSVFSDSKPVPDDYHFDIGGMGNAWCSSGMCAKNLTTVDSVKVWW
jgi:hypothetical protein